MDYFKNLPEEMTLDILSRVPTESIFDCKSVCKPWNNLVSHHPSFSKMHLHHLIHHDSGKLGFVVLTEHVYYSSRVGNYDDDDKFHYFEYNESTTVPIERIRNINFTLAFEDPRFLGSSNGLICLCRGMKYCILNLVTNEYVMLPEILYEYDFWWMIKYDFWWMNDQRTKKNDLWWMSGFGYVSSTNEYKVVGICVLDTGFAQIYIYTLGSGNGWRNLGGFDFGSGSVDIWKHGIFANEVLYWVSSSLGSEMIVTFDLVEERFREHLPSPPLPPESGWFLANIGALDGFLFLAIGLKLDDEEDEFYDIWLLRKKNDNHALKEQREEYQSMVWSKEFRIDKSELFAITKTGGVLTYTNCYLNVYDTKASTSIRLAQFQERICQVIPHKNTLVSLKELGEETKKIWG